MSTHTTTCVVCGKDCYCHNDTHALGCGGSGDLAGAGGCHNPPYIEFCSLDCALTLQNRLIEAIKNYHHVVSNDAIW